MQPCMEYVQYILLGIHDRAFEMFTVLCLEASVQFRTVTQRSGTQ